MVKTAPDDKGTGTRQARESRRLSTDEVFVSIFDGVWWSSALSKKSLPTSSAATDLATDNALRRWAKINEDRNWRNTSQPHAYLSSFVDLSKELPNIFVAVLSTNVVALAQGIFISTAVLAAAVFKPAGAHGSTKVENVVLNFLGFWCGHAFEVEGSCIDHCLLVCETRLGEVSLCL
jgi:hypothetical protein